MCGTTCGLVSFRPMALNNRKMLVGMPVSRWNAAISSSAASFDSPYTSSGPSGVASSMQGPSAGAYTAALDAKTTLRTEPPRQLSSTRRVPSTFTSSVSCGRAMQSGMKCMAAR